MMKINWNKEGSFNHGRMEGTDYRCERFWVGDKDNKQHWYMLADSELTYRCCKGPFSTPQDRDESILIEVEKRK